MFSQLTLGHVAALRSRTFMRTQRLEDIIQVWNLNSYK